MFYWHPILILYPQYHEAGEQWLLRAPLRIGGARGDRLPRACTHHRKRISHTARRPSEPRSSRDDQAGGAAVCQELARALCDELALGGGDSRTPMHDQALATDAAGLGCDRAHEVDAGLEARVTLARSERGLDGAPHCRIQDRHRVTAMHNANGVVKELTWLTDEDCSPLLGLR